jgi:hypothetical protein
METSNLIYNSLAQAVTAVIRDQNASFLSLLWSFHPHELAIRMSGFIGGSAAKQAHLPGYVKYYNSNDIYKVSDLDICVPESSAWLFEHLSSKYPALTGFGYCSSAPADDRDPTNKGPRYSYNYMNQCNVDVFVLPDSEMDQWSVHTKDNRYMSLQKLVDVAKEWNRDKDKHFVEYVKGLVTL